MTKPNKFLPEVRERAAHPLQWAAVVPTSPKLGCVPQLLLEWVNRFAFAMV